MNTSVDSSRGAFAFQTGEWRVSHRKLRDRLAGSNEWFEFDGTCRAWELLGGIANADDNVLNDPSGAYRAVTFRKQDPNTGLWSIWWFDPRFASLEPPVVGKFDGGVGQFFGTSEFRGRDIQVRFIWSDITADRAHWQQAFSADGGKRWEANWYMTFDRIA